MSMEGLAGSITERRHKPTSVAISDYQTMEKDKRFVVGINFTVYD